MFSGLTLAFNPDIVPFPTTCACPPTGRPTLLLVKLNEEEEAVIVVAVAAPVFLVGRKLGKGAFNLTLSFLMGGSDVADAVVVGLDLPVGADDPVAECTDLAGWRDGPIDVALVAVEAGRVGCAESLKGPVEVDCEVETKLAAARLAVAAVGLVRFDEDEDAFPGLEAAALT